ncbi:tyrosine-type recombinase/integrase [Bacillus sp. B1-b2]|uniref:tyrosine-type recombinase/integrase n=1 Tax=Bacillus sp. B1-b2 TaxID=2653201 RepID=UPI001261BDC7|nr:tyrosine-type recombinase/integrase [Bacillus sp. B1-b2]KAB7663385.1 tyrosine-type recombinase/integrase [Bacillus sp. B1-b2]
MAKVRVMKREELEKTLEELFEDFQLENKIKNLSEMTIRFYDQNLVHYFRFLKEIDIVYVREVEKKNVDKYILWLKKKGLKATTINTYMRAVRSFLYFAMRENYLIQFEIKLIKADKEQKEPYSEGDIKKLIKKPNIRECGFVEHRNWVLVNYLLETGNRLKTVINLMVQDIDFDNGMIILTTTKNRKAQYNPISEQLVKVLTEYIRMYRLNKDDYLFINELGNPLTRNSIQHSIARYNKKRGVEKTSIHAFRHTFAKYYITSGGDSFKLQRLLGHSTLDVTLNYVNLYSEDLKEGFDKHSILSNYTENPRMRRGKR